MDLSILPNNNHPDKFLQLEGKSLLKSSAFLQASLAKFPEAALPGVQRWHNRVYLQLCFCTIRLWLSPELHLLPRYSTALFCESGGLLSAGIVTPVHVCKRVYVQIVPTCFHQQEEMCAEGTARVRCCPREKRNVTELPGLDSNRVSQEMIDKALGKHITPITLKSTIKCNPLYSDIQVDDDCEEKKKTPCWTVQDYERHSLGCDWASHIKENPNDLQFWMGDIYTPGYDTLLKKKEREKKHSKCCRIILFMVLAVCILITIVTLSILLT
nr:PREDICTED: UPF0258 protein KIAA1024-like homolog [Opisthocomus hoazin]